MNTKIDNQFIAQLVSKAKTSDRKHSHFNFHKDLNEPVQRLCIALIKGTYVCPHHHPSLNKWELMLPISGKVCLVIFDRAGVILEKITLGGGDNLSGIELQPNTWHTVYPIVDEAVIMEVKEGPYTATQPSDFANWAPQEGEPEVGAFLTWLENAIPGDAFRADMSR